MGATRGGYAVAGVGKGVLVEYGVVGEHEPSDESDSEGARRRLASIGMGFVGEDMVWLWGVFRARKATRRARADDGNEDGSESHDCARIELMRAGVQAPTK